MGAATPPQSADTFLGADPTTTAAAPAGQSADDFLGSDPQTVGGALQAASTVPAATGQALIGSGNLSNDIMHAGTAVFNAVQNNLNEKYGAKMLAPGEILAPDGRSAVTPGDIFHWVDGQGNDVYNKTPPPQGVDARPRTTVAPIRQVTAPTIPNFWDIYHSMVPKGAMSPLGPLDPFQNTEAAIEALQKFGSPELKEKTQLNQDIQSMGVGALLSLMSAPEAVAGVGVMRTAGAGLVQGGVQSRLAGAGADPGTQLVASALAGHLAGKVTTAPKTATAAPAPVVPPVEAPTTLRDTPDPLATPPAAAAEPVAPTAAPSGAPVVPPTSWTASAVPVSGKPHIRLRAKTPPGATPPTDVAPATTPAPAPTPDADTGLPSPAPTASPASAAAMLPARFKPPGADDVTSGPLPPIQQDARAGTLQNLNELSGGKLDETRTSAITGDDTQTGTDFKLGALGAGGDEAGARMQGVLTGETNALRGAAQAMVDRTGTVDNGGNEQAARVRGGVIHQGLSAVQDWLENGINGLYSTAKARAQGVPMPSLPEFVNVASDRANFNGQDGAALWTDVQNKARQFGLVGNDGFWKPANVNQVEDFRKWLRTQWKPETATVIDDMRDALDRDVTRHAGEDIFAQGRAMNAKKVQMLQNATAAVPKGAKKTASPITQILTGKVPIEQIPDFVANLPTDHFNHLVNVLKSSAHLGSGELDAGSTAAFREIKGHIAAQLRDAGGGTSQGQWGTKAFYKKLDNYANNMPAVFTPREMHDWQTINDSSNILRTDKTYKGAFVEAHNLGLGGVGKGILKVAQKGADLASTALGAHAAGPLGAIVGHVGGGVVAKGAGAILKSARMRAVEGRITNLAERAPPSPTTATPQPLGAQRGNAQRGAVGILNREAQPTERRNPTMLNVGMDVDGGTRLSHADVLREINNVAGPNGAKVMASSVHQSNTEPTVVATLDRDMTPSQVHVLSARLRQQAVAQLQSNGKGALHGPGGPEWDPNTTPFNPQYFMTHSGKPINQTPLGARLFGGKQQGAVGDLGAQREGTPQDKFMDDFEARFPQHPTEPDQRKVNGNVNVAATRDPINPSTVHIEHFSADTQEQGHGGRAMQQITGLADQHGTNLTLRPVPQMTPEGKFIPQEKLERFYMDNGFKPIMGETPYGSEIPTGDMERQGRQFINPARVTPTSSYNVTGVQPEPLGATIGGGSQRGAVGTLNKIKPHLLDDEMPVNKGVARSLINAWNSLPSGREFAAMAAHGAVMKNWYRGYAETIGGIFKADAPRFTATLASLSPLKPVASNLKDAIHVFTAWSREGRPTDMKSIADIVRREAPSNASSMTPNVYRALTLKNPETFVLSGPKVHSFYKNLMGNVMEVTNDGWMAKGAGINAAALGGSMNEAGTAPGKGTMYRALAAKQREAADILTKLSGEKWDPDQVQAGAWSFIKAAYEYAESKAAGGATIPQLLKRGDINDKLIGAVPSFQKLFGRHADTLRGGGFEPPAEVNGPHGGESDYTPSEALKTVRKVLEPDLRKTGRRLEGMRQKARAEAASKAGSPGPDVPF